MSEEDTVEDKGAEPTFPVDRAGREIVPGVPVKERKKPARKSAPKTAKVSKPSASVKREPAKRFSFEQWAARRGVPAHHRGGLRAFVNNVSKQRSVEEWDECFKAY